MSNSDSTRVWVLPMEAVAELRISKPTVYRWIREGRLPAYQIGDSIRIDRADLDAFIRPVQASGAA